MNSRGRFFIVFSITCVIISTLFYLIFRPSKKHVAPSHKKPIKVDEKPVKIKFASYLTKIKQGLPGLNKKPAKSSENNDSNLGKPLPAPKMPVAPPPLIVKAAPAGPPAKKKMME